MNEVRPDEIYNLAAQSHVGVSFDAAEYIGDVDAIGMLHILKDIVRAYRMVSESDDCSVIYNIGTALRSI